jgi:putative spermidine/putrescine transport system permease protein
MNYNENKLNKPIIFMLIPSLLFLLLLFIYPFLYGIYLSFTNQNGIFTLSNYIRFFSDSYEVRTIWISLYIALPITIINVIFAIPFAYYMRRGLKHEKLITLFLILPISLGIVLLAEGMLDFYGPQGWFNKLLISIGLINGPLKLTHNYIGVMLSLFIQGFPFAFLMLLGYTSGINPDLEKAAQMLGANKIEIFTKVMLPLMAPGIAIAFALNFVMAFSVFPSAVLLGEPSGPTRVIAYAAYQWAFEKYNFNMGASISIIMAVIEIIIIGIVLYIRSKIYKGASIVGKG